MSQMIFIITASVLNGAHQVVTQPQQWLRSIHMNGGCNEIAQYHKHIDLGILAYWHQY